MSISTIKKTATVKIKNKASYNIISASVVHKYSDNYKNSFNFNESINGNSLSQGKMTVEYNVGLLTTGKDWWLVSWVADNGKSYITNPNNFRILFDFFDNNAEKISQLVRAVVSVSAGPGAGDAAANLTNAISSAAFNTESTVGFKQHILREADATEDNLIIIKDDKVLFSSRSGISETVIKVLS